MYKKPVSRTCHRFLCKISVHAFVDLPNICSPPPSSTCQKRGAPQNLRSLLPLIMYCPNRRLGEGEEICLILRPTPISCIMKLPRLKVPFATHHWGLAKYMQLPPPSATCHKSGASQNLRPLRLLIKHCPNRRGEKLV